MGRRRYYRSRRRSNDFGYRQSWMTGKGRLGRDSIILLVLLAIGLLLLIAWKAVELFDSLPLLIKSILGIVVLIGLIIKVIRGFKELLH